MRPLFIFLLILLSGTAWAQTDLAALGREAGKIRQLPYRTIRSSAVTQKQAAAYVLRLLDKELEPKRTRAREAFLKELGLMPRDTTVRAILRKLYASQVRGLYDPSKKQYIVVKDAQEALPGAGALLGFDVQDLFTVHELGHAIQDQHFNLSRISKKVATNFDEAFAAQSIIEGDASLLMMDYAFAKVGLDPSQAGGLGGLGGGGLDPGLIGASDPNLAAAPAYFREWLTAPYTQGLVFAQVLRAKRGWKGINQALQTLPPSSEHIYHPEKYLAARDLPKRVPISRLPSAFGSYKKLADDQAGEFSVRILNQQLRPADSTLEAAAGWGGDAYRSYSNGKNDFVIWLTVWDSTTDAKQFAGLMQDLPGGKQRTRDGRYSGFTLKGSKVTVLLGVPSSLKKKVEAAAR